MIDTIVFRIHNLKKHERIVNQLATSKASGASEIDISQSMAESYSASRIRAILYHDHDNIIPVTRRNDLLVPSSHYSVSYQINYSRDFMEFNLSIPKYLYSTNVMQHINYYDQGAKATFYVLMDFFEKFFQNTLTQRPDLEAVEIRRIDMCYNQFFVDKASALSFLEHQKKLMVKYARSSKNNYRSYDTSFMFVTSRYSFKVYHKGTEFKSHDLKHLKKHNPLGLSLDELEYNSERTLRYEMTFRTGYLNYILKKDIIAKPDIDSVYAKVLKNLIIYNPKMASKIIDEYERKTLSFRLKSIWDSYDKNKDFLADYMQRFEASFDSLFFESLYKRFWIQVEKYQLSRSMSIEEVQRVISEHNKTTELKNEYKRKKDRKQTKYESRLVTLAMLSQFVDIGTLKGVVSRATLYRYQKELKDIGINMFNAPKDVSPPKTDYQEYRACFGKYHLKNNAKQVTRYELQRNTKFDAR